MNIGIDIDGVLTDLEKFIIDYGIKFCLEEGLKVNIKKIGYDERETFNWTQEQADMFWERYFTRYVLNEPQRMFATEVINKLREQGNKIYIITARNEYGLSKEYYGKMQELTKKWLNKQNIVYDKLIFARDEEKILRCKENNIEVMIEDSPKNIKDISRKINVIKFNCKYNEDIEGNNIFTAYSWWHIFKIIDKLRRNKRGRFFFALIKKGTKKNRPFLLFFFHLRLRNQRSNITEKHSSSNSPSRSSNTTGKSTNNTRFINTFNSTFSQIIAKTC